MYDIKKLQHKQSYSALLLWPFLKHPVLSFVRNKILPHNIPWSVIIIIIIKSTKYVLDILPLFAGSNMQYVISFNVYILQNSYVHDGPN